MATISTLPIPARFPDPFTTDPHIPERVIGERRSYRTVWVSDIHKVLDAWDHLDVGGIVVNDVSSYRVDNMPYGGVKDSGLGREGVRFAMEDMTEIRNLVIRRRS